MSPIPQQTHTILQYQCPNTSPLPHTRACTAALIMFLLLNGIEAISTVVFAKTGISRLDIWIKRTKMNYINYMSQVVGPTSWLFFPILVAQGPIKLF